MPYLHDLLRKLKPTGDTGLEGLARQLLQRWTGFPLFLRATARLFCACDAGTLVVVDARSGRILNQQPLSGVPDVVWFNRPRSQLYVAVGDPGVIDVFDTSAVKSLGTVAIEKGAHTTALAPAGDRVYAFLPATHRAAVYEVSG